MRCILIGLPTWYVIGILLAFSNKFGKEFGIKEAIDPARSIMYAYVAISAGDVLAGLVSQAFKSRKKTLYLFYAITAVALVLFFRQQGGSAGYMYFLCALLGFGTSFWAIFVTSGRSSLVLTCGLQQLLLSPILCGHAGADEPFLRSDAEAIWLYRRGGDLRYRSDDNCHHRRRHLARDFRAGP